MMTHRYQWSHSSANFPAERDSKKTARPAVATAFCIPCHTVWCSSSKCGVSRFQLYPQSVSITSSTPGRGAGKDAVYNPRYLTERQYFPCTVSAHHKQASSADLATVVCCSLFLWVSKHVFRLRIHYYTSVPEAGRSALSRVSWHHAIQGRIVGWAAHTPGTASDSASVCLYSITYHHETKHTHSKPATASKLLLCLYRLQ